MDPSFRHTREVVDTIETLINGTIVTSYVFKYYKLDMLHIIKYMNDKKQLHREDGPALTEYFPESTEIFLECWYKNGKKHRENEPAKIVNTRTHVMKILYEYSTIKYWYQDGKKHRPLSSSLSSSAEEEEEEEHLPAVVTYKNGILYSEEWYINGLKHRSVGPAIIEYQPDGILCLSKTWYRDNMIHRPEGKGPAKIEYHPNGNIASETWYSNGEIHRENLWFINGGKYIDTHIPAKITYYEKGNGIIHTKTWYRNGLVFRDGGKPVEITYRKDGSIKFLFYNDCGLSYSTNNNICHGRKLYGLLNSIANLNEKNLDDIIDYVNQLS